MSKIDHSNLDGRLLQLLVAVFEEGSITGAAERLNVTQSAVSHLLDKLRVIVDDPLFVKSGRGIVPTARAEDLAVHARVLLEEMQRFAASSRFDPATLRGGFTIAANDLQRDLLLPPLLDRLRATAPGVCLRVIPSAVPNADMLRKQHCDLVISPRPPDAGDILQKRLFADHYRVFYDASRRAAPASLEDYLAADHVTVVYEPRRSLDLDEVLLARGVARRFVVTVPGFAGIPAFVRDSTRIATAPSLLGAQLLRGLASAPVPVPCPGLPMYLVWHLRNRHHPAHSWLRQQIEDLLPGVLGAATA